MNVARGALFLLTIAGICSASGVRQIGNPWPSIAPIAKTFHFADAGSASVELRFRALTDAPSICSNVIRVITKIRALTTPAHLIAKCR